MGGGNPAQKHMDLTLKTPPAVLAVTLDDAKLNLRIDGTDHDTLVSAWLGGVIGYAENIMRRSIMTQTWCLKVDSFPRNKHGRDIRLPMCPVIKVTSVKYIDENGDQQTLDESKYVLTGDSLIEAHGAVWPEAKERMNAVEIEYDAGYGSAPTETPKEIRLYVLAKLNEQFDPAIRPEKDTVQASFIDRLLDRYLVVGFS